MYKVATEQLNTSESLQQQQKKKKRLTCLFWTWRWQNSNSCAKCILHMISHETTVPLLFLRAAVEASQNRSTAESDGGD